MLYQLAAMVGEVEQGAERIAAMQADMRHASRGGGQGRRRRPASQGVFEECGYAPHQRHPLGLGADGHCRVTIGFPELAQEPMGKQRIIADGAEIVRRNPDIILGSWCGKKFRPETWLREKAGLR